MAVLMRMQAIVVATLLMFGVLGCAPDKNGSKGKMVQVSRQAPPPPPARNVPLDAALIAGADHELNSALNATDPIVRAHVA